MSRSSTSGQALDEAPDQLRIHPSVRCRMRRTDVQQDSVERMTAPALEVSAIVSEKTAIVHVAGELDLGTAPELEKVLHGLERECARIVLDLSHLRFIDSTGLRLAVIEHHRATMDGFEF